ARLRELGAATGDDTAPIFVQPEILTETPKPSGTARPELHWYLSFRSPYTGIVADRVKALADAYGADLKLRFVLPMAMRGMEIRRAKGFYIMGDVAREADRMNIPFGNMFDPIGKPVERGYAILNRAIELGRGYEFAQSFLSGVWADGLDAGSDRGLKAITERAGLSWAEMKPLLGTDDWRAVESVNQDEMLSYSIWGVPSFRVGDVAAWGQDRLWIIEDALKAATTSGGEGLGGE
ncbi:MAG: DsbA family protein, partial [Henriciella sp.]|nr:DsbA family protein [Henriciella sp.]